MDPAPRKRRGHPFRPERASQVFDNQIRKSRNPWAFHVKTVHGIQRVAPPSPTVFGATHRRKAFIACRENAWVDTGAKSWRKDAGLSNRRQRVRAPSLPPPTLRPWLSR